MRYFARTPIVSPGVYTQTIQVSGALGGMEFAPIVVQQQVSSILYYTADLTTYFADITSITADATQSG